MKKKTDIAAAILRTLEKLGPSSPRQVLDAIGGSEKKVGYYLRKLLAAKALKATGTSSDRVYALASQKLKGAASSAGKAGEKTAAPAANKPVVAMTADRRLVIVYANDHGTGHASVFDAEFTDPIAELLKAA